MQHCSARHRIDRARKFMRVARAHALAWRLLVSPLVASEQTLPERVGGGCQLNLSKQTRKLTNKNYFGRRKTVPSGWWRARRRLAALVESPLTNSSFRELNQTDANVCAPHRLVHTNCKPIQLNSITFARARHAQFRARTRARAPAPARASA